MSLELIAGQMNRYDTPGGWHTYHEGDTITLDTEQTARLFEAGAVEDPAELGPATNPTPGDTSARWAASGADLLTDAHVAQLRALTSGLTNTLYGRYERVLEEAQRAVTAAWAAIASGTADRTTTATPQTVIERRREEARALHALTVTSAAVRATMGWS